MKRVLIIVDVDPTRAFPYGDAPRNNAGNNIFYASVCASFIRRGGRVFLRSAVSRLLADDPEWARRNFDLAVTPEACILCGIYRKRMLENADLVKRLGIPVYVLGVGVHAVRGAEPAFVREFADEAKAFLGAVRESGGKISVRGRFTQEACAALGYRDCFISGCTALYLMGPRAVPFGAPVARSGFIPALNAARVDDLDEHLFADNPSAVYFDQDVYSELLRGAGVPTEEYLRAYGTRRLADLYHRSRKTGRTLIHLHQDLPAWSQAMRRESVAFSYGSRIHGNLMALLSGIPCFVRADDPRVSELVEFYRIPSSDTIAFDERRDSLYDLYRSLDWSGYAANYERLARQYGEFLDTIAPPQDDSTEPAFPPFRVAELEEVSFRTGIDRLLKRRAYGWKGRLMFWR